MTNKLRKAFKFFLANAGYCTPPGRAQCALDLARAEQWAWDEDYSYAVIPDDDVDISWMAESEKRRFQAGEISAVGVILLDTHGERTGTSLWGIIGADYNYLRVVKAELALEQLNSLKNTLHLVQQSF